MVLKTSESGGAGGTGGGAAAGEAKRSEATQQLLPRSCNPRYVYSEISDSGGPRRALSIPRTCERMMSL